MFSLKSLFIVFINLHRKVVKFDKFTVKPSSITLTICLITLNVQGVRPVSANEQKMVEEQGKKREWKTAGKEKKRAYRHLFELTSVRPLPADFQKCQNVRCRRVFKRLPCLFESQKRDWLKWWRKLSNLTNRTVYQNEVLKKMLTGLTVYGPYFPVSPQHPLTQGVWGLSQRCARSIWLICYRKTSLESS